MSKVGYENHKQCLEKRICFIRWMLVPVRVACPAEHAWAMAPPLRLAPACGPAICHAQLAPWDWAPWGVWDSAQARGSCIAQEHLCRNVVHEGMHEGVCRRRRCRTRVSADLQRGLAAREVCLHDRKPHSLHMDERGPQNISREPTNAPESRVRHAGSLQPCTRG